MFKFIFGLLWTSVITPIFMLCLIVPGEQRHGVDMNPPLFIFFLIFEYIGLFFMVSGIRIIKQNKKTRRYGKECYGLIQNIDVTGSSVNGKPEYKASVQFVNPITSQVETLEEIIGFDYNKYNINTYVLCKYYEGDINIEYSVSDSDVPLNYKNLLSALKHKPLNIEFSSDGKCVTIDGVEYIKK